VTAVGGNHDLTSLVDPFVGRQVELCRIATAWAPLGQGTGSLVVVSGEAGVGKTRLCTEAVERARRDGFRALVARCWHAGAAPPLWPWQAILVELCGDDAADLFDVESSVRTTSDRFARFVAMRDMLAEACAK
jgi:predicted ATPase